MKKTIKKVGIMLMCALMLGATTACNMNNTGKGAIIGGGGGGVLGAGVGALIGKNSHNAGKGAAIGAAVGTAVGAGVGALIGNHMDKKQKQLEQELGNTASVEETTDKNGFKAIKVTFADGILFPTNGTTLSDASKAELKNFAGQMKDLPDTDITIFGHTDNTGSAAVNERISNQRAGAVASYLQSNGISASRMTTAGKSYNEPVADNATAEGRAKNRRVEVYISANENMIKAAENGTLQ